MPQFFAPVSPRSSRAFIALLGLLVTLPLRIGGIEVPAIAGAAAAPHRGYAALGASETVGVGALPQSDGYAYLVARALHARPFVNLGISGTTLPAAYNTELRGALAIHPRLCTVFFGFNDFRAGVPLARFKSDLYRLVHALRRAHAQVLIIGLPDLSLLPIVQALHVPGVRQIVAAWDGAMRDVARRTGASFLDLRQYNAELAHHPEYIGADGLHPSNAGYARIAQEIMRTVKHDRLWPAR